MIVRLLDNLERVLYMRNNRLKDVFHAGISKRSILEILRDIDLTVPIDFLKIYQWKNGMKNLFENDVALFPLGIFFSLQEAVTIYEYHIRNKTLEKNFFPMFGVANSEFFLLDCDQSSASFGKIFYFSLTDYLTEVPVSYYDNLQTLVFSVTECYKGQAYYFVEGEVDFIVDFAKERKINEELNPNSDYWKLIKY